MSNLKMRLFSLIFPEYYKVYKENKASCGHHPILHHAPAKKSGSVKDVTDIRHQDDSDLVKRIIDAYSKSVMTPIGKADSIWLHEFADINQNANSVLAEGHHASVTDLLRNPCNSMLFYGFESIQSQDVPKNQQASWREWQHLLCYDNLLQLARATGLLRVENPEAEQNLDNTPSVEELLTGLDAIFGFRIDFPNIFIGEIGLETSRGIANYRAIQSLYQAWRIGLLLLASSQSSVCEIGGGLGRTAYYAAKMGIKNYTIIDIPLTGVSQAYFLGRVLGGGAISLYGEQNLNPVRIYPPVAMHHGNEKYDLIVNFDSITEMSLSTAKEYLKLIIGKTGTFLSINHEQNCFTVAELLKDNDNIKIWRTPCWSRRGYVEELVKRF